ncbi:MAG: hypothetical protein K2W95_36635 [Candidatus Obscuribacterales bacterium]|nr:hypothetical protein [Candidatus Obscuribacterales bacterium]
MNYAEATQLLLCLPDMERKSTGPLARTMSLETMKLVLDSLGNPQDGRGTVHITGSKGKGSTSAFIAGILHSAGRSTALYSSPHLHDYTERIHLNLEPIAQSEFANGVEQIRENVLSIHSGEHGPVSTFGVTTALFFQCAKNRNVQWQIVEVGMGGTLDATNVFNHKQLAVITAVSMEHTSILGKTNEEIARNKSGIITEGCTVVLAKQHDPAVERVIQERCNEVGARLINVAQRYRIEEGRSDHFGQHCIIHSDGKARKLQVQMLGRHQLDNLCTAIAAMDALIDKGEDIGEDAISSAAASIAVAGRLEVLGQAPLVVADGAHNGESAAVLADALKRHFKFARCIMVVGTNSDKNTAEIIQSLKPATDLLFATRSRSEKAMPPATIGGNARDLNIPEQQFDSLQLALDEALAVADQNDLICITGSLYLVGEGREYFGLTQSPSLLRAPARLDDSCAKSQ